jgi:NhaP-type Na+/H+ or K+/H+ antiporter
MDPVTMMRQPSQVSIYLVLFSLLLALVLVLSKLLHDCPRLSLLPEAGMILLVGMTCSVVVDWVYDGVDALDGKDDTVAVSLLSFSPQVFFLALLPPIIFNSGYHLRRELFFRHLVPITLLAVVGTTVSAVFVAVFLLLVQSLGGDSSFQPQFTELLTFGGLISATDPVSTLAVFQTKRVDPQLFYLVFGESVLNDAVGLVLFQTFARFVLATNEHTGEIVLGVGEFLIQFALDAVLSPIFGILCAVGTAYLFKIVDMRSTPLLELCLYVVLIMYVPFLTANILQLSGIVTILFTGMAAHAYVMPNLSSATVEHAESLFRVAAHIAETSIFLELGLSVFGMAGGSTIHIGFTVWAIVACLIGRAIHVYPIAFAFNYHLRRRPHEEHERGYYSRTLDLSHHGDDASDGSKGSPDRTSVFDGGQSASDHRHHSTTSTSDSGEHDRQHLDIRKSEQANTFHQPHSMRHEQNGSETHARSTMPGRTGAGDAEPEAHPNKPVDDCYRSSSHDEGDSDDEIPFVRRDLQIAPNTTHMVWFSGLRGAVAYACVRSFPNTYEHRTEFTVVTMIIVLVTVFGLGSTTEAMLNLLHIEMNIDEDQYSEDWARERPTAGLQLQRFEAYIRTFTDRDRPASSGTFASTPASPSIELATLGVSTTTRRGVGDSSHPLPKRSSLYDFGS